MYQLSFAAKFIGSMLGCLLFMYFFGFTEQSFFASVLGSLLLAFVTD